MDKGNHPPGRWFTSMRFLVAILGFFGFFNMNAMRGAMSFAIVCMVRPVKLNNTASTNDTTSTLHCPWAIKTDNSTVAEDFENEFEWTKETQSLILSSFFWGYCVSQIPGGWLADSLGGRKILTFGLLLASICTLLAPIAARFHYITLIIIRFLTGLGSGVSYPAMHALWGKWAPPFERSRLTSVSYAGSMLGVVLVMPISASFCRTDLDNGWPLIFYTLGGLTLVWILLWQFLVSDTPAESKRISRAEKNYIIKSLKDVVTYDENKLSQFCSVPWLSFCGSMAVWAIIIGNITSDWGMYTIETNMPTYLAEVLQFDIKSNGFFSAIPYIYFWITIIFSGLIADKIRSKCLSTKNTRKLLNTLGQSLLCISFISISFLDCTNWLIAIIMLTIGTGAIGFSFSGFLVNHVDIAPAYAGALMGISNSFAALISGFGAPYVIGILTPDSTPEQWKTVFFVAASVVAFGVLVYGIFAQGTVQEWAKPKTVETNKEMAKLTEVNA